MILPFVDPWIALAGIACNTEKIRFGPLVTPLPRRRPWKVAREAITLDHLSKGRVILGVGLGAPPNVEFDWFGEESDVKIRAEQLDESLDIITGLWTGESFSYSGNHFNLHEMTFLPKAKQKGGIPIWVGGGYPHSAPFRRAAKFSGVAPVHANWPEPLVPEHIIRILEIVRSERTSLADYDVVVCGETTGTDSTVDCERIDSWQQVGVTWFLEDINGMRADVPVLRERIRRGPPN
jgi:alkanesulfonate monooxygenase SsuD/methylene tetrahydromethanopterin reductase-like flavin-dependent oxidoreductase (luciferase family)